MDLISRQAAIDALHAHLMYRMGTESNKKRLDEWINNLPPAQPEKRTEERTKTHACDLIDRQAAIDALADMHCKSDEDGYVWIIRSDAWARIDALPSATPKQRWIPCSERLPENGHYYLWCSDGGNVQSDYYWDGFENGKKFGYNIIAWMPLPEPFREEGDE